jgi:hypothetical protein
MKENLILRKNCTEGPTSYALKKPSHPKINSCTINKNWNIYTIFIQLKTTFFEKSVKTILYQFTSNFVLFLELIVFTDFSKNVVFNCINIV